MSHHGFSELHQLDDFLFYNSLNSNDKIALDSAAGGISWTDASRSTDVLISNSSSSNNSFDMQQIAASLEDKMTIKMNQMMSQMKALVVTTPAPVKAVEEDERERTRLTKLFNIAFLKVQTLRVEIGLKDALVEIAKVQQMVISSCSRNKEKLEEIAFKTELNKASALADSGASINLLPHSITKNLSLEALTPTRCLLELQSLHEEKFSEDVEIKNSNVPDKLVLFSTLSYPDKDEWKFYQIQFTSSSHIFLPVEDCEPTQEGLIFSLFHDDLIPPGVLYGYVKYHKKSVKKRTRERMSDQEAKEINSEDQRDNARFLQLDTILELDGCYGIKRCFRAVGQLIDTAIYGEKGHNEKLKDVRSRLTYREDTEQET
ncbi:hypothetical protein Tco_0001565 [Tanacetum coccineum]